MRRLFKFFWYHLYLLQLENYELLRYWRLVRRAGWLPQSLEFRKGIDWTLKLFILIFITIFLYALKVFALLIISWKLTLVAALPILALFPLFLSAAALLFSPCDWLIKYSLIFRAKQKLKKFRHLKIIGIAGSYGKTTVKEFVAACLENSFRVLVTPENINTPIGISRLILKKLTKDVEVFVVEMGEYYPGDIREICKLTPPDISVVTGINEAHLERMKTLDNTVSAIYEVVRFSKIGAKAILNADDALVVQGEAVNCKEHAVAWYGYVNNERSNVKVVRTGFNRDGSGQLLAVQEGVRHEFKTRFRGEYVLGSIAAAILVGKELGLSIASMRAGIEGLEPVKHRLEPIPGQSGVLVIDDSYNGNPAGVREAIKVLGQFTDKRKIFLTPGLVETGERVKEIHTAIGKELAQVADKVILIKNSVTPHIAEGLIGSGFNDSDIIWFSSAQQAHRALGQILQPNDVILFQNDWGDNYV